MSLPQSSVLVPLYVYPLTPESWAPLYDAIQSYPRLSFTVIINPNSGPGEGSNPVPDERYCLNITRLNTYPNVTLIGYIRIDYCKRSLRTVLQEVEYYGQWASLDAKGAVDTSYVPEAVVPWQSQAEREGDGDGGESLKKPAPPPKAKPWHLKSLQAFREKSPFRRRDRSKSPSPAAALSTSPLPSPRFAGENAESARGREYFGTGDGQAMESTVASKRPLQMQGIFFDETPNIHEVKKAEYLEGVTRAVKEAVGIGEGRLALHNPGTMPDAELVDPALPANRSRCLPDVAAVFEASYAEYMAPSPWMQAQMAKCRLDRTRKAFFVHSVPAERVKEVTLRLRQEAGHVFVTDLKEGFYCSFDRSWGEFVKGMAT